MLPEVREVVRELPWSNPSSPHADGRLARRALDSSRDVAAAALGGEPSEVVFTSGGTEAINLALLGLGRRLPPAAGLVTWEAEHQAVLGAARRLQLEGVKVRVLGVDGAARADPSDIPDGTGLVSIGLANNEVGTLQPVEAVIERAHELGAQVHLDACQGLSWVPLPPGADLVSVSGHKIGAGRGGLLKVAGSVRLEPLVYGGPQERGKRAGREDVMAAAAAATALSVCCRERERRSGEAARLTALLQEALTAGGARPTGGSPRLPNFASGAFRGLRGEDLVMALDLEGISASSGSACASGSLDPSHVLLAMGLSIEEALGSLRLTIGHATRRAEVEVAVEVLQRVFNRLATPVDA